MYKYTNILLELTRKVIFFGKSMNSTTNDCCLKTSIRCMGISSKSFSILSTLLSGILEVVPLCHFIKDLILPFVLKPIIKGSWKLETDFSFTLNCITAMEVNISFFLIHQNRFFELVHI